MVTGVDTSALYYYVRGMEGLNDKEKRDCKQATRAIDEAYRQDGRLIIPNTAVIELANIIHHRDGLKDCQTILEGLLLDSRNEIVLQDEGAFTQAQELSKRTGIKFTDCVIYLTLKKAGCTAIITTDGEFRGFKDIEIR